MPFDPDLAERIRSEVADVDGVSEQRMFGGLAFLVDGNMAIAASGQGGLLSVFPTKRLHHSSNGSASFGPSCAVA